MGGSTLQIVYDAAGIHFPSVVAGHEYNGLERWYSVYSSGSLTTGVYTAVSGSEDIPADGGTNIFPVPGAQDIEFFRLEAELR